MQDLLYHMIHLTHGVLLYLMGAVLWAGVRPIAARAPAFRYLALFALLLGTGSVLRHIHAEGPLPDWPAVVVLFDGMAYAALLLFAVGLLRVGAARSPLPAALPWGLIALWLVLYVLAFSGVPDYPMVEWLGRILLAVPAMGLIAHRFIKRGGDVTTEPALHRPLWLAGWGFVGFLLALLPGPSGAFFPVSFLNEPAFFAAFGVPVQLFQTFAILLVTANLDQVLNAWRISEQQRMAGSMAETSQALAFSEAKFKNLFQQAQDAILISDATTGVVVDANPAASRFLGKSHGEIIGLYQLAILPEDMRPPFQALFGMDSDGGGAVRREMEVVLSDGRGLHVDLSASRFMLDGWALAQFVFRDISVRKETEKELIRAHNSLDRAQTVARMGNWEWDPLNQRFTCSAMVRQLFGILPDERGLTFLSLLARIHADDRSRVQAAVEFALANGRPHEIEYRVEKEGDVRIFQEVGEVHADGKASYLVATVRDITEQIRTEDKLVLAKKIFDNAFEAVVITDAEGIIQSVNPAFIAVTGFDATHAVERNISFLLGERHRKDFFETIWKNLRRDNRWQGEVWTRHYDGKDYPKTLTVTAIQDRFGNVTNFVGVFNDLSLIKKSEEKLAYEVHHDALTGLPNRVLFKDRLYQSIHHAERFNDKVAVMIFGLDSFKKVNDSLGFTWGDTLLKHFAMRLKASIRNVDTKSRLGGDEFAFILPNLKEANDAVSVIRKMMDSLSRPFRIKGREIHITASVGITLYPDDGDDVETLIRNANMAVDMAKKAGGNNYKFFTSTMGDVAARRLALEEKMRKALAREEFVLFYQPKVDLRSGLIVGAEGLVRWIDPEAGMVSPGEFIPLAEETGLIIPIGEWVLRTACVQAKKWADDGFKGVKVGVNLSARQFVQKDLTDMVQRVMQESGVDPRQMELEITESMVMNDLENAINVLKRLKDMGLSIAVDDFGTGYSSLGYLKRFPINTLKIDRSFVKDLPGDSDDAAIVSAIVSMSHKLSLSVVAEGVETWDQWEFLGDNQCDEMQGFLFSRPVPAAEFTKLLMNEKPFRR